MGSLLPKVDLVHLCVEKNYETDNEIENIYRDIIGSNKMRGNDMHSLQIELAKIPNIIIEDTKEEKIYREKDYKNLIERVLLDKTNDYKMMHREMVPEFEFLFEGYIKDKPEYNFSIWGMPFITEKDKWKQIPHILRLGNCQLTYGNLDNFLNHYLTEFLTNITKRIDSVIQSFEEGKVIIDNKLVNSALKTNSTKIVELFSNVEYINEFKEEVLSKLRSKIERGKSEPTDFNEQMVNDKILMSLSEDFPFLFDALDCRDYFYKKNTLKGDF